MLWLPASALGIYIALVGRAVHDLAPKGHRGRGFAVGLGLLVIPTVTAAFFMGTFAWVLLAVAVFGYFVIAPLVWRFVVGPSMYDDKRFLWPWQLTQVRAKTT